MKNKKEKKGIIVSCYNCGKNFYLAPFRLKNKTHTCSYSCSGIVSSKKQSKKIKTNCVVCQKDIFYKKSHFIKLKGKPCCSRRCRGKFLETEYLGDKNPNFILSDYLTRFFLNKTKKIKYSAKRRNLEFNLSEDCLLNLYIKQNGTCYYSSMPMKLRSENFKRNGFETDLDTLSVDRIDSSVGYIDSNVVLCCNSINKFKSSFSQIEVESFFQFISSKYNNTLTIYFTKLHKRSIIPIKSNKLNIGYDLSIAWIKTSNDFYVIGTGLSAKPDNGWILEIIKKGDLYKNKTNNNYYILDNSYNEEIILKIKKNEFIRKPKVGEKFIELTARQFIKVNFNLVDKFKEI